MKRELWTAIVRGLKRLPRWWPRNAVYSNRDVLAVFFWAAIHNEPVSWACRRSSWPIQAWRRALPDQSTMSRRMRDPRLWDDLRRLLDHIQASLPDDGSRTLIVDGKPLAISNASGDPDAETGWAAGLLGNGYKLHLIIDAAHRVIEFDVRPMNEAESTVAMELVGQLPERTATMTLLADAGYDSNDLYRVCESKAIEMIAPRKKPGTGLGHVKGGHAASRLHAIKITEGPERLWKRHYSPVRDGIERFLSGLTTSATGLFGLPPWIRRLHRVKTWVAAKLVINAARMSRIAA